MTEPNQHPNPLDREFLDAVRDGDMGIVRQTRAEGANVDACYANGNSALLSAVAGNHYAVAEWLLDEGADMHAANNSGDTPLFKAAWDARPKLLDLLLERGANPNWPPRDDAARQGRNGFHALHRVCVTGELVMAKALIRAGADVDAQQRNGGCPLWFAGANNSAVLCSALLAAGADPNGRHFSQTQQIGSPPRVTTSWQYALHKQENKEHIPTLRVLLDGGADMTLADSHGKTLEDSLKDSIHHKTEVLAVLAEYKHYPAFEADALPTLTKAALFAPNAQGYCLLDSPSTWTHFAAIADALENKGEALTAEDFLATGKNEKTWLARGVECFAAGEVFARFAKAGGDVGAQMLDTEQQPTPLMELVCERQQVDKVMVEQVWRGTPHAAEKARAVCEALPFENRADVRNRFQLHTLLAQDSAVTRGR